MPFAWVEFVELAAHLVGLPNQGASREASERTAVSRAYFAAYCHVRDYATRHLRFRPQGNYQDHELLRDHLRSQGGSRQALAANLDELRKWRNDVDYQLIVSQWLTLLACQAIQTARDVIDACK
jgi:GrpB-like predicted nucleotidyltransferase (UPF0157 family)